MRSWRSDVPQRIPMDWGLARDYAARDVQAEEMP
jgi:hypothetical protein